MLKKTVKFWGQYGHFSRQPIGYMEDIMYKTTKKNNKIILFHFLTPFWIRL
jgi:hypothetical protein